MDATFAQPGYPEMQPRNMYRRLQTVHSPVRMQSSDKTEERTEHPLFKPTW